MKKDLSVVEKHTYTVLSEIEEIYPETGLKLVRPKLNIKKVIFHVMLILLGDIVFSVFCSKIIFSYNIVQSHLSYNELFIISFSLFLFVAIMICRKRIFIFIIRIYQKYAPYQVRSTCLYIPNCSEYMILAIKKYGLIKGISMGIKRYKRCEPPHGGIDYP